MSASASTSYRDTVLAVWRENRLFSALVELTYRCNLDCVFCYNDLAQRGRELTLSDYECFFGDLATLGCLHLTLTGGEPLAHPHFFEIGAAAKRLGFLTRIKSNGHVLRGHLLERLQSEIDPFIVEVSLHGAEAETHDRQTRVSGSFDRLLSNLQAMKSAGLRFKLNTTLTRWNEDELEAMQAIARQLGCSHTVDPDVTPRDDGDLSPLELSASPVARRRIQGGGDGVPTLERDSELPASGPDKHCGAGSSGIAVDPFGNVYPCVQWRRALGNLHDRAITDIWNGNPELETVREITGEVKRRGASAWFCPGAETLRSGSPYPDDAIVLIETGREGHG